MAVPAQELEKLDKLASKAPLPVELAGKYQASSWDAQGFPTADKEGALFRNGALCGDSAPQRAPSAGCRPPVSC